MYSLSTDAYFDSAHFLADYKGKCENLHGHRWKVTATIGKEELGASGTEKDMVQDFGDFKKILKDCVKTYDHTFLIEKGTLKDETISALEGEGFNLKVLPFRTTAENLARAIYEDLSEKGLPVISVEVDETPNNRAIYSRS